MRVSRHPLSIIAQYVTDWMIAQLLLALATFLGLLVQMRCNCQDYNHVMSKYQPGRAAWPAPRYQNQPPLPDNTTTTSSFAAPRPPTCFAADLSTRRCSLTKHTCNFCQAHRRVCFWPVANSISNHNASLPASTTLLASGRVASYRIPYLYI